jgi:PiT family inorganic phosphate transporter
MSGDIILVIVVATALAFDFTNGFHDTANVVATAISTRAIAPKPAVAMAAMLNFVGAFLSLKVAATVGKGFVDTDAITTTVVFAGLVGAIGWNVITWYFGLPSSSSHALIGGLVGAVIAAQGFAAVNGDGLFSNLIVPAIIAPPVAFLVAGVAILLVYRIVGSGVRVPSVTAFASVSSPPAGCWRSRTAPTMRRRRWALSRSRSSLTATYRRTGSTSQAGS